MGHSTTSHAICSRHTYIHKIENPANILLFRFYLSSRCNAQAYVLVNKSSDGNRNRKYRTKRTKFFSTQWDISIELIFHWRFCVDVANICFCVDDANILTSTQKARLYVSPTQTQRRCHVNCVTQLFDHLIIGSHLWKSSVFMSAMHMMVIWYITCRI